MGFPLKRDTVVTDSDKYGAMCRYREQRRFSEDQRQGCRTPQNSEEGGRGAEVSASEAMGLKMLLRS